MSVVAILGFQFGLYHHHHDVIVNIPLSFLGSNQPCIIVTFLVFLFLADNIFYRSYIKQQHFCIIVSKISNSEIFQIFTLQETPKQDITCAQGHNPHLKALLIIALRAFIIWLQ